MVEEQTMRHGFQISFAFSEFATAALLVTVAACGVSYFYTKNTQDQHTAAACSVKETVVENHYITVPAPVVHVKVVVPKPEPPKPAVVPQSEKPKVWDNDNLPHADDEPDFDPDRKPVITTALRKP
jgi:hypothetical protein